ncbi:DNA polymerase III subunit delta [Clostridium fermenticellae]|uniref:DNA polymerase III subunit delta n=1 Tax=Clostridium fermenticellae TaxID=2068654 RepID=A0A386H5G8_9CLOT|nr:DNA polymerase III subunit delta [Clostridium fermenticellae]AYD40997.1 DNA polymerase III subunit delta [Clostridium fermenticellae]
MIDIFTLNENLKNGKAENCYLLCGSDEKLIKDTVNYIVDMNVDKNFRDLNYEEFDGTFIDSFEPVINACETMPLMSSKKVVLVYRASFLNDDKSGNPKLHGENAFKCIYNYLSDVPDHCILIFYDIFKSKRDKPGKRIYKLDKKICVVRADKIKGYQLESRVKEMFELRGKQIGRVELRIFCSLLKENDLNILENEVEKLCCYVLDEPITKDDIKVLFFKNNYDDIFDLTNPIANKKIKESIQVLNELIYKGEKIPYILNMIEKQFYKLLELKIMLHYKEKKQNIMRELNMRSDYAYEINVAQSKKFTFKQLKNAINLCLTAEERIKSSTIDPKTEMELLIINSIVYEK